MLELLSELDYSAITSVPILCILFRCNFTLGGKLLL